MTTLQQRWNRVFTLRPAVLEQFRALRVVLGLAIPALILVSVGRPNLMIFAVFGAVTGMYARGEFGWRRVGHQAEGAAVLFVAVALGLLMGHLHVPGPVLVAVIAVFAAVVSIVSDRLLLSPGGPFFGIFALGAVASVPASTVDPWLALAIFVGTSVLCLVLGYLPTMWLPDTPHRRDVAARPLRRGMALGALANMVATGLAGAGGVFMGTDHIIWSMTAAISPLIVASMPTRLYDSFRRFLGTLAGLVLAAILLIPQPSATVLVLCLVLLLGPTEIFLPRAPALALGVFTPLIMLMTDLAHPDDPILLLVDRALDTIIGLAAGIVVAMILLPRRRAAKVGRT